ncbi:DODA-type extradiol aromatic ring-opening family dioxygenase [Asticcacaulis excentricus]|uniref:Extradiol ring-cleavage dioxygenase class III protein subunit B n=1 Tax=Asticcacaulis excentricus (strain ATCC 15261 / DSM 4724 / KCTC 12464 / NCIMB 9791 / VKM B-1370 / CB 48) TaxID=573065 RepID=E8RUR7_ASTEC|nr:class III extradiol ring-cleavage dioxygenase [Asticcacaulis excentricus]ADU14117.1 Extradiol ring-cleavage dioxygenase class III protein subunit B [Asticcacaulis excentricus CB 48]
MPDTASPLTPTVQPTLFIPHGGGPCFFMDWSIMGEPADTWDKTAEWLRNLASTLPEKPKAIIVVSGHWEETVFTAATSPQPEMIFDYYGFPKHTYELNYSAPGSTPLAERIVQLLTEAGIPARTDAKRGFDHGVFIPFLVAFPDADIPVVPLSLKRNLDPAEHIAAGRALKSLREEGVLIVGSGMSYHNMHAFRTPSATAPSKAFDEWLTSSLAQDKSVREDALNHWSQGPAARNAHPREEHLLPLMIAAGAGEDDKGTRIFSDVVMQATISAFRFG